MLYRRIVSLVIITLLATTVYSQGPGDPTGEDPDSIPIGKAEVLLAAGIVFGMYRLLKNVEKVRE